MIGVCGNRRSFSCSGRNVGDLNLGPGPDNDSITKSRRESNRFRALTVSVTGWFKLESACDVVANSLTGALEL